MTGNPAFFSARTPAGGALVAMVLASHILLGMARPAQAQKLPVRQDVQTKQIQFDLPAQPLSSALQAYAHMTRQSVFFDGLLAAGLQSQPVYGNFRASEALRLLLDGSGLSVTYTTASSFTLTKNTPVTADQTRAAPDDAAPMPVRDMRMVQATLEHALCRSRHARPGNYRAVLKLWVAASGYVARSRLMTGTGDAQRDAEIEAVMKTLRFAPLATAEDDLSMVILLRQGMAETSDVCARTAAVY